MNRNIEVHLDRSAIVTLTAQGMRVEMLDDAVGIVPFCGGNLARDTGPGQPPAIGQPWPGQGGVYAGLMRGSEGTPDYHLIVSTDPAGNLANLRWGGYEKDSKATSDTDGLANTRAMQEDGQEHPVLDVLKNLRADGHQDFYLPARRELSLCFANVKELFETDDWFWSSTQDSAGGAWYQGFGDGSQGWGSKDFRGRARAVRRLPA